MRRAASTAIAGALLVALTPGSAFAQLPAIPIPGPLDGPLPRFTGAPTTARPLPGAHPTANPALAPDGRSGSGLAAANGAASPLPGPLGNGTTRSSALQFGTCASLAFDQSDRLLALCNGLLGPTLRLIDPASLATIATLSLPPRLSLDRTDLAGGTHLIVRADDSLLVPTNQGTLVSVAVDPNGLRTTGAVDLAGVLAAGERPFAVAAGYDDRDWAVGNQGTVVAVGRGDATLRALALGEPVAEDIATDPSGTYVVSRDALYRLVADAAGRPRIVWRLPIPSDAADPHAGRIHAGSGTPPAIVGGRYVAVADDRSPPRITVARIGGGDAGRIACAIPVFAAGAGSIEAHLVVAGHSIVAANAYGYDSLLTTEGGSTTQGGIVQIGVGSRGCRIKWTSNEISPSAQPVVSRQTGLLYTLVKPPGFPDAWNLAAIDWRTGSTRFTALAGEGLGFNSDGGALALGPDGAAYAGSFGGVVRFRDRD